MYQQKVDFAQLRSELQTLDKNEFASTKNEHDRLSVEIEKLRQKFKEEVNKIQASVRLDLNLEKGRIRDESSVHELKIKETDNRIEYFLGFPVLTRQTRDRNDAGPIRDDKVPDYSMVIRRRYWCWGAWLGYPLRHLQH